MTLYTLSGRFAQIGGLIVGLVFAFLWLGAQWRLPPISGLSQAFVAAHGTLADMIFFAVIGFSVFLVATVVFALIGNVGATFMRDLRKSGWK